jgi:hypothetical protein
MGETIFGPVGGGSTMSTPLVIGGVVLLVGLLALRELTSSLGGDWRRFTRYLNLAILPLLIAFAITITMILTTFVSFPPPLE